jgi:diketogulonate reductase-like aldo/keto reductase
MKKSGELCCKKIPLNSGAEIAALGFGTLIPDHWDMARGTEAALHTGFRHLG